MPDNLRDRIAAVICHIDALHAKQWSLDVADAVIRELKLTRFTRSERIPKRRYVTEWTADESDKLWRIIGRTTPYGVHESVNGKDCYVFKRRGGSRPTDIWSVTYQPVETFWCAE